MAASPYASNCNGKLATRTELVIWLSFILPTGDG